MPESQFAADLEAVLRTDPSQVAKDVGDRVKQRLQESKNSLVLFGAGQLGIYALRCLRKVGIEPLAFADNNPRLWNTQVQGVYVLSPTEAERRYGAQALFVITVFTSSPVRRQLSALHVQQISFAEIAWCFGSPFLPYASLALPHDIVDQREAVWRAGSIWEDDKSRQEYLAQLQWRTSLENRCLPTCDPVQDTYFPDGLIKSIGEEVFFDCGAFDGDSVRGFLARRGKAFKRIVALEPDQANFDRLQAFARSLSADIGAKFTALPFAVGAHREWISFDSNGTMSSKAGDGTNAVECVPLDEILCDEPPTYIKMDIEGAEPEALVGARKVIGKHSPVLAVCLYHKQEHLWQIPLFIRSLSDRYRLFLRRYSDECWEQICYAVPEDRLRDVVG